jgi:hypothetical protein
MCFQLNKHVKHTTIAFFIKKYMKILNHPHGSFNYTKYPKNNFSFIVFEVKSVICLYLKIKKT